MTPTKTIAESPKKTKSTEKCKATNLILQNFQKEAFSGGGIIIKMFSYILIRNYFKELNGK